MSPDFIQLFSYFVKYESYYNVNSFKIDSCLMMAAVLSKQMVSSCSKLVNSAEHT